MYTAHILTHQRQARRPASARQAAASERLSYDSVLREAFFDSRVKLAAVCPETALMYAVLEDAFLSFCMKFQTERPFIQRAREAED